MELINLDMLNEEVKKKMVSYCSDLLMILGSNIRSILIYGSASSGEYIQGKSDINLLVVCDKIDIDVLKSLEKVVKGGIKRKIPPPLLFTPEHIKRSKDVFPIEFLEMKDNHVTIYGEEIFEKLDINDEHLRLECEEQIKGKLIRTRQAWFEATGNKKRVASLLYTSLVNIIPSVKGIIRLKGETPPLIRRDVIDMVDKLLDIDLYVFVEVLDAKKGVKIKDIDNIFQRYLEALYLLASYVDKM